MGERPNGLSAQCSGRSDRSLTAEPKTLLDKTRRAIQAATTLLREDDPEFAGGRAYYAMFYAAEALLLSKGLRFQKQGGVHVAFGEHFVKSGLLDHKFHRWLLDAFDQRVVGDYGVTSALGHEDAAQVITHAEEFLDAARQFLEKTS